MLIAALDLGSVLFPPLALRQGHKSTGRGVVVRGRLHGDTIVPYKIELAK